MNLLRSRIAFCGAIAIAVAVVLSGCHSERAEIAARPNIPAGSQLYDVVLARHSGSQKKIGQVAADIQYRLQIVSVIPSQKDFLTDTIDTMNSKTNLHAEAAPPEGAPRFSDYSRMVDRNSPAFFTQLQAQLRQYYDLILQPAQK
jgi:hypothetical protein